MIKKEIEICFSPLLFDARAIERDFVAVVCDIFRATTSFCRAFFNGAGHIIPLPSLETAQELKSNHNVLVAGERDGIKPDFADFGNDPAEFTREKVEGRDIYYTTTNGTKMLLQADEAADQTIIASFLNISEVASCLSCLNKSVVICCSGWKGRFSFEDAFFAGALAERLLEEASFTTNDDGVFSALQIWNAGKDDPATFVSKRSSHFQRLSGIGKGDILQQAFRTDACPVLPVMESGRLVKKQF